MYVLLDLSDRQSCLEILLTLRDCAAISLLNQGSPQTDAKADWVGVVWAEFATTSIDLLPTSKLN